MSIVYQIQALMTGILATSFAFIEPLITPEAPPD
jgi:hypothetical protein